MWLHTPIKMAVDQSAEQNVGVVEMDTCLLAKILSNYKDYYECNVDAWEN
jgi:hypothetical protein